ncbi:MAG: phosphate ABC transporter permease subunit PstC [Rhodospirillales bacterium]|jgi:phosphate transport system permease protein|nr:phosphate ABC transporter permease subunit PstC [Rhodospirillales bacterium]MBT5076788.1 phosphate ABC transporter permease subunit PstC [Rhodospirillales bacterium]MBT5112297.1 phosphate ABC transporter permease subunit PstC [Rhodospirillales bacterium]MBT5671998.1 phosphate ABC transporter permease subunit PstC [Rhodospirillales bacterium]MBT6187264.1 phosphate ABC transporter permease subunit PstC [Rhodospirillales bacterium]
MNAATLTGTILLLAMAGFYMGRARSLQTAGGDAKKLHSLPGYHGTYVAFWAGLPALGILGLWVGIEPFIIKQLVISGLPADMQTLPQNRLALLYNDIQNIAVGASSSKPDAVLRGAADHYSTLRATGIMAISALTLGMGAIGLAITRARIAPALRTRPRVERLIMVLLIISSTLAVFTTIGIVLSLIFESLRFFEHVSLNEFLFGLQWSPQTAMRADQVGSSGSFGAVPVFTGTLLITAIAMLVAGPIGLMSAIYMAEYASPTARGILKPALEILAGIPTVVFGFFAALTVAPAIRDAGASLGLSVASESALAAGVVMGIMIIPFVSSLSDDVINAVPQSLRDGSYAIGATRSETIKKVIIPAALPGIVGSFLLAISRAIGETMIVVMAAGLAAKLTANPLEAVTTVTVQIVTLLVGDQEFDSPKTLAAFALGLALFCITLALNLIALKIVRKYREEYE